MPVTGTARRLQALARIGYSCGHLSKLIGVKLSHTSGLRSGRHSNVTVRNARLVAAIYEQLSGTPATTTNRHRIANDAQRNGWPSPMAWEGINIDDPNASPQEHAILTEPLDGESTEYQDWLISCLLTGSPVKIPDTLRPTANHRPEFICRAVDALTQRGKTAKEIGELLEVTERCIQRVRHTLAQRKAAAGAEQGPEVAA